MPFRWIVDGVRDSFAAQLATSAVLWGTLWAGVAVPAGGVVGDGDLPARERLILPSSSAGRGSSRRGPRRLC